MRYDSTYNLGYSDDYSMLYFFMFIGILCVIIWFLYHFEFFHKVKYEKNDFKSFLKRTKKRYHEVEPIILEQHKIEYIDIFDKIIKIPNVNLFNAKFVSKQLIILNESLKLIWDDLENYERYISLKKDILYLKTILENRGFGIVSREFDLIYQRSEKNIISEYYSISNSYHTFQKKYPSTIEWCDKVYQMLPILQEYRLYCTEDKEFICLDSILQRLSPKDPDFYDNHINDNNLSDCYKLIDYFSKKIETEDSISNILEWQKTFGKDLDILKNNVKDIAKITDKLKYTLFYDEVIRKFSTIVYNYDFIKNNYYNKKLIEKHVSKILGIIYMINDEIKEINNRYTEIKNFEKEYDNKEIISQKLFDMVINLSAEDDIYTREKMLLLVRETGYKKTGALQIFQNQKIRSMINEILKIRSEKLPF